MIDDDTALGFCFNCAEPVYDKDEPLWIENIDTRVERLYHGCCEPEDPTT